MEWHFRDDTVSECDKQNPHPHPQPLLPRARYAKPKDVYIYRLVKHFLWLSLHFFTLSSMSALFVEPMTITPCDVPMPSISTNNWFNVCSSSLWPKSTLQNRNTDMATQRQCTLSHPLFMVLKAHWLSAMVLKAYWPSTMVWGGNWAVSNGAAASSSRTGAGSATYPPLLFLPIASISSM